MEIITVIVGKEPLFTNFAIGDNVGLRRQENSEEMRMNSIIGIINSNLETLTDRVVDVDSECLEEPIPHPFDRRIMNTAYLPQRLFSSSAGVYAALRIDEIFK